MNWDRQTDETEEWYDRFRLYLYMGPDRTITTAHTFATRLAKGAAHGQLGSWRRAAQRHQWKQRAEGFDAELAGKALASDERLRMIAELLHQVYSVLRHADLLTLTKEEARQLLPTFRLFFRDLLRFHQSEAAQFSTKYGGKGGVGPELKRHSTDEWHGLSADELMKYMAEMDGLQLLLADIKRVNEAASSETSWQPLRDVLAQLYPDEASARRIAAQAHLDSARIHFSARAVDGWHAILTEAAHAGLVESVIGATQQEYPGSVELTKAISHYRLSRLQELPPEKEKAEKVSAKKRVSEKAIKEKPARVRRKV